MHIKEGIFMKLRTVLPMLAVATFALAACAPKVDYAKFHELAVKAAEKAKEASFSKVVLDGYEIDEDGKKQEFDNITVKFEKGAYAASSITHLDEVAVAILLQTLVAENIPESDKVTYYAGGSFKVVSEEDGKKNTMEWNDLGLLTSMNGDDGKLTVKYSK